MNDRINPLRSLPKIVAFQLMCTLALMWTVIFCAWTGMMAFLGPSMAAHAVLLIGVFFTADIFRHARRRTAVDHRRMYRDPKDQGVLYDDIWGG